MIMEEQRKKQRQIALNKKREKTQKNSKDIVNS